MTVPRRFFFLLCFILPSFPCLRAQDQQTKSPVFKSYTPPKERPVLQETDLVYESWLAFNAERKAVAGDPVAQHEIGIRYLIGRGVQADTAKGAYWIAKAAAQNLVPARFNLGILDYNGWGVPWNPFDAFRQFLWCAEHDMPEAQLTTGQFYTQNLIVPVDMQKAEAWIAKAAHAGYAPAVKALEDIRRWLASHGQASPDDSSGSRPDTARVVQGNLQLAPLFLEGEEDTTSTEDEWKNLRTALRSADPEVRNALGISRIIEENMDLDSLGLAYIRRAAAGGSPEALAVLGRCYERGILVAKDPVTAMEFYIRALRMDSPQAGRLLLRLAGDKEALRTLKARAEAGDDDARYCWAGLLALGYGGVLYQEQAFITERQAVQFLEGAAAHGHPYATIELGLCYYAGRWVAKNQDSAFSLWERAAATGNREAAIRMAAVTVRSQQRGPLIDSAVATLRSAVREGSLLAEIALGYCYETGAGVQADTAEAARLYTAGARRGSQDAFRAIRRMLDAIRPAGEEFALTD